MIVPGLCWSVLRFWMDIGAVAALWHIQMHRLYIYGQEIITACVVRPMFGSPPGLSANNRAKNDAPNRERHALTTQPSPFPKFLNPPILKLGVGGRAVVGRGGCLRFR